MVNLTPIGFLDIVVNFAQRGYLVHYVDKDETRRTKLLEYIKLAGIEGITILDGKLTGYSTTHCQVLILVNEFEFDEKEWSEIVTLPSIVNDIKPLIIKIEI